MGRFVTALCQDLDGNLWVGTEDTGVWRYDSRLDPSKRWTQFTRANTGGPPEPDGPTLSPLPPGEGPGVRAAGPPVAGTRRVPSAGFLGDDHAYALACDKLGRVWVGHLNHGVSVYNGQEWRNYDVLTGPLGERVFDIETCPADGDVWIATNAGLARYRLDSDAWRYYTPADGLPADEFQCLAFAPDGTLYAGTQCDGLAVAAPSRVHGTLEYRAWRTCKTSEVLKTSEVSGAAFLPPCGDGLPSDLINDLLVARDGTVYAATITGLAASRDRGRTWQYLRGRNWEAKARGLYKPPSKEQLDAARKTAKDRTLLAEDYVTCLAEDAEGNLWIGYREKGFEVFDPRTGKRLLSGESECDYVTRLLAHNGRMLAASYGAGVGQVSSLPDVGRPSGAVPAQPSGPAASRTVQEGRPTAALPSPAPAEVGALFSDLLDRADGPRVRQPRVIPLSDDWRTQGDWLGRYGRHWACLSAIRAPHDYVWGAGETPVRYTAFMGPHHRPEGDLMRFWVWELYSAQRRVLELPPVYLHSRVLQGLTAWDRFRRPAGWDDHAEAYPYTFQGPDLYVTLDVPDGRFFLSFYFMNYDGHQGRNRHRDYVLSVRTHAGAKGPFDVADFDARPELARSRVKDWYAGVYKRFFVRGPAPLAVRVEKNWSFNTMLMGVFLDPVEEEPDPYFPAEARGAEGPAAGFAAQGLLAERVLGALAQTLDRDPAYWAARRVEVAAAVLRRLSAPGADARGEGLAAMPRTAGTCYWLLGLYPQWEATQEARLLTTARQIEKSLRWDGVSDCMGRGHEMVRDYHKYDLGEVFLELKRLRQKRR